MDLRKILEFIFQIVFLGFGDKLKGYRTIIFNIFTAIVGSYEWIIGSGLLSYLCDSFNIACNIETTQFYGIVLAVIGAMNAALRMITDTPVPPIKKGSDSKAAG